jgi:signal transduction histidine kinase
VETLIEGDADDPEMAAHSLSLIHRNVQRLSLLLEDLLTISSVESRGHALDFSSVNLRELFDGVLANLQAGIASGSVDFDIKWDEAAEFAEVDAKRIEQVYWNLLTNAIRHGEVDPLSIRIVAKRCESSIVLAFTDNGAGIPLEDQIHIFERFYRVHKHRARDKGGTGLGLSIVKNIIMAHGGSVSLQSTPGEGSTFFVTLPIHQKGILLRGKS